MIEEGPSLTVRENVHQVVDALPEDRLSAETEAAIEEGMKDIREGPHDHA